MSDRRAAFSAPLKMAAAAALYCAIHSLFASRPAKNAAVRLVGRTTADAFYRAFFNAQSLVGFAALALYGRRLPDRVLYEATGSRALALRIVQASGIAWAIWTASHAGIAEMLGLKPIVQLAADNSVTPPDAQGPTLDGDGSGISGPFLLSRHPLNFAPLPVFWATPRLTASRLAFNLIGTAYLVLGSVHEEARLKQQYGSVYESYTRSGVPFFVPKFRLPPKRYVFLAEEA